MIYVLLKLFFLITASGRPSMGGSGSGGRDRFNSTNRDDAQSDTQVSL